MSIDLDVVRRSLAKPFSFIAFSLILSAGFHAQTIEAISAYRMSGVAADNKLPEFEVATIKPVDPKGMHLVGVNVYPGGRVVIHALPLKMLICVAFKLGYWQLSGGEDWTDKVLYDIEAVPPENVRSSVSSRYTLFGIEDERLRQMVQALLIGRFHLRFHKLDKIGKEYFLETSGKALRMHPTEANPASASDSIETGGSIGFAGQWVIHRTTMPQLAKFASDNYLHRPVLDRTGLSGTFEYRSPPEDWDTFQSDPVGSFLNFIRELGLSFQPAKGQVEIFVIDHADRPSPN